MSELPVVCVMGPTASGKTEIAVALHERFPSDIVSVDSALVYRGMDIGTAKPDAATLERAPHKLIDIREPEDNYSAGDFITDARREIDAAHSAGRVPVLAGGTMLYFRSLIEGLAELPAADVTVRQVLDQQAAKGGWPAMHARLATIDAQSAARINANDSQRIQRALEVFELSGKSLSWWHRNAKAVAAPFRFIKIALIPTDRAVLHARIESRLKTMLQAGFVQEVRNLSQRPELTADHASMRAVGYRQFWAHIEGRDELATASQKALVATRQLAKRQLTWLRSERDLIVLDPLELPQIDAISAIITKQMDL